MCRVWRFEWSSSSSSSKCPAAALSAADSTLVCSDRMHVCNNVSPLTSLLGADVAPWWRRDVHYLDGCSRAAICVLAFGLKCVSVSSTCKACSSKRGPGWWAACVAHHGQLLLLRHATHAVYSEGLGGGLILSWWWAACVAQNGRWLLLRHAWYAVYSDGLGGGLIMGWWAATVRVWRTMAKCCCRDSPEAQGSCIFCCQVNMLLSPCM